MSVRLLYHMSDYTLCRFCKKFGRGVLHDKLATQREFGNNGFSDTYYKPALLKDLDEFLALKSIDLYKRRYTIRSYNFNKKYEFVKVGAVRVIRY